MKRKFNEKLIWVGRELIHKNPSVIKDYGEYTNINITSIPLEKIRLLCEAKYLSEYQIDYWDRYQSYYIKTFIPNKLSYIFPFLRKRRKKHINITFIGLRDSDYDLDEVNLIVDAIIKNGYGVRYSHQMCDRIYLLECMCNSI